MAGGGGDNSLHVTCESERSQTAESEKAVRMCDDRRLYHWKVSKKGGGFANQEGLYEIA